MAARRQRCAVAWPWGAALAVASLSSQGVCDPTLYLVQMVFRHGDRSAINIIPTLPPVHWPQGPGQLSHIGMKQQFAAGFAYRQMYGNVVGWNYSRESVLVRSTDTPRTITSADSQLAGWFPQNETLFPTNFPIAAPVWLPIPVHVVPVPDDSLLRAFDDGNCPTYRAWRDALPSSPQYAAKRLEPAPPTVCASVGLAAACDVTEFIAKVGSLTGFPDLDIATVWKVSDTLFCRSQHDKPIFDWASANGGAVMDYLNQLESWSMYSEYNSTMARRLTGGNMVAKIISNARAHFSNVTGELNETSVDGKRRLLLYSAHDTTVAALMCALDADHFGYAPSPPYASAMIVELWSEGTWDTAFFRLRYQHGVNYTDPGNVTITQLVLRGCAADCPVDQFASLLADVIPQDWAAECGLVPASSGGGRGGSAVTAAVVTLLVLALAVGGVALWRQTDRDRQRRRANAAISYDILPSGDEQDQEL